jgi:hypothetical protein
MSRCRFLVDECVPSSLVRGLSRRIPEVTVNQVGDKHTPPKGTPDNEVLEYCEKNKLILITADRSTLPNHVAEHLSRGHHTWGVLVVGANISLGQMLDDLCLIHEASEDFEWMDVFYYLPLANL